MAEIAGGAGFLHKPFNIEAMIEMLHSVIRPLPDGGSPRGITAPQKGGGEA
jgi:hypothetical protein